MTQDSRQVAERPGGGAKERLFTRDFLLACFVTFFSFASFYLLLATLPVYIVHIGGGEAEVGLIIGVFSATALVLRPFVGQASDERGKRLFIVAGNLVLALATGLYSLARSVALLLGLRVFHGVGWAAGGTAISALVADLAPRSRRGEAMGYFGMFNNLAMAVGPALGVMVMNASGFEVLFAAAAALAVVALLLALPLREPARAARPPGTERGGVIERSALFPSLVLTLMAMTYGSIVSFVPIYGASQGIENPGIFFTVYAAVLIVARAFTGQISDRYGRPVVIVPGLGLAGAALWVLSTAAALPSFLLAAVLYGLAFAAVQPALMALVVDRAAPNRRGAAMGTFSTAMDLGIGSGSMIWGVVAQTAGFTAMYTASATVAVLALAVFLAGTLRRRGQAVDHQAPAGNP